MAGSLPVRTMGTTLPGVVVFEPDVRRDERGFFVRTLDAALLRSVGLDAGDFVQHNQSRSAAATLRGLHLRAAPGEAKLVRCASGAVFDVVVDLRPASPTFGRWESFQLDDESHRSVYVPRGFGHGFQVLTASADVAYLHDAYYDPAAEAAVRFDDPDLAVRWPLPPANLSRRDREAPALAALLPDLQRWFAGEGTGAG